MYNQLKAIAVVLGMCSGSLVLAESTLVFEKTDADGVKSQQTISISGRWLRSETDQKEKPDYSLFDSGRLMLFNVDDAAKSYQVIRVGNQFWPDAPPTPKFKATKKRSSVAGVPCILVQEMGKEGPVAEHCMAGIGPMGLNRRELIATSRLFMTGRAIGAGEIGVATPEERQISIQSKSLVDEQSRILKSVSHKPTPNSKLKVPESYKRIHPDLPRKPIRDPEEYRKMLEQRAANKAKQIDSEALKD